jgi:hypothetical protein
MALKVGLADVGQVALASDPFDDVGDQIIGRRGPFAVRAQMILIERRGFVERDQRFARPLAKCELGALLGLEGVGVALGLTVSRAVVALALHDEIEKEDARPLGPVRRH